MPVSSLARMLGREDMLGRPEFLPHLKEAASRVCVDLTFDAIGRNAAAVGDVLRTVEANCVKVSWPPPGMLISAASACF